MTVLVARLDSVGDVLLSGPAIRAVARSAPVLLLCSPTGQPAAELLPGVDRVEVFDPPWIAAEPPPVRASAIDHLVERVRAARVDEAVILTSFHQSPLPLALVLRLAGVGRIAAVSEDYPGSLLDVRHRVDPDVHEVERSLSLVEAAGHPTAGDDALQIRVPVDDRLAEALPDRYVVVHPGASVPARTWHAEGFAAVVDALRAGGTPVVVTGGPHERALAASVAGPAGPDVRDLAGARSLGALAQVLAGADAVVVGNTGPAHLAAAVGTPVVSIFPPTVPAARWRPWGVPHVLLGDQAAPCAGCRTKVCPRRGHPCLADVRVSDVVAAVEELAGAASGHGARA